MLRQAHSKSLNLAARTVHLADGTAARRAELERFDYLPREEQEQIAMQRMRELLSHAFERVPYYAEVAQHRGLKPEHFQTYDDLGKLPVLTKQIIRARWDDLVARGGPSKGVKANYTGGSTGEPLTFVQDARYRQYSQADKTRCYERCNYRLGEPLVFLWGSDYDSAAHKSPAHKLLDRLGRNLLWVNTFDLSEDLLERYALQIAAHKPVLLVGYVASLTMYARFLQARALPAPSARGIQASAETLTDDDRELLGEVFGCPVFDRYGCREVGLIAHECEAHAGLHLSPLCNLVELLDAEGRPVAAPSSPAAKDDQPAGPEVGRVVVTNLNNYAMPFIRYEIGDLAVRGDTECSCGRSTPLLQRVVGRTTDVIVSPGGKLLHGEFFTHLFYGRDDVRQFQVIQLTETDLTVRLVPAQDADLTTLQRELTDIIHQHGDPGFVLKFETCDTIPTSSSGKYRFTISELDRPFADEAPEAYP